jgi:hypothetical protein
MSFKALPELVYDHISIHMVIILVCTPIWKINRDNL